MMRTALALTLPFVCVLSAAAWAVQDSGAGNPGGGRRGTDLLKEGDPAPDFTLKSPDGKTTFQLSSLKDKKPVVLIFGSFT